MLNEFIRTARLGAGLSQNDLAAQLDVPRLAITRVEAGTGSVALVVAAMRELHLRLSGIGSGATLPDQLRQARIRRGLALENVADRTGLDRRTIEGVESAGGSMASLTKMLSALAPNARPIKHLRSTRTLDAAGIIAKDSRFTSADFLDDLTMAFGDIDLDPCGHPMSPVVASRRIILPECGLQASWAGSKFVFINPPFSTLTEWMTRAADAWDRGEIERMAMLIPVRTDADVFQRRLASVCDNLFLAGRLRFSNSDRQSTSSSYAMMLVLWGMDVTAIERFLAGRRAVWLPAQAREIVRGDCRAKHSHQGSNNYV
jgi:transcriptional regulator with XRE-family HTH domain